MKERNRELALVGLGGTIGVELVDMCGCSKCDRRRAYEAARELKNKAAAAGDAKETSEQRARAMAELDEEDGGVSLLEKTVDVESYGAATVECNDGAAATPENDVNGGLDAGSYLEHYANAMALLEGEENASDVDEGVGIDCCERFAGQHVQDAIATPEAGVTATHDEGIAIEHASVGCQVDLDEDFGLYEYICRAILEEEPHVKAESDG